jgi:hypothetical protein
MLKPCSTAAHVLAIFSVLLLLTFWFHQVKGQCCMICDQVGYILPSFDHTSHIFSWFCIYMRQDYLMQELFCFFSSNLVYRGQ